MASPSPYETVRQWCQKFGPAYARKLKKRQCRLGDTWHIDEVFVTIQGDRHYLGRAVDQDGDVINILVQRRRNQQTAERFFRRLIKGQGGEPRWLVTDSFHRESLPIAVIPDIRNRESILVSFRMDTRYKLRV